MVAAVATVSGETTTHLLEGLQSGETYTISIITISDESTSDPSMVVIHLNVTGHIKASTNNHVCSSLSGGGGGNDYSHHYFLLHFPLHHLTKRNIHDY